LSLFGFVDIANSIIGVFIGYGFLWLLNSLYRLLKNQNGIGMGDAKLLAALGAWLGWAALPGILTGVILSLSRAIGEAAPLIMIGALSYVAFVPKTPMDVFTALPIQIFNWASRPKQEFHELAAAGIIVLLVTLLLMFHLTRLALRVITQRKDMIFVVE
jgi:ABC-type phosphate transport system permease subunit